MKIRADWRVVRGDIFFAACFAVWMGGMTLMRLGVEFTWANLAMAAAALLVFFLWPMISDFWKALRAVMAIRSSRDNPALPLIPKAPRNRRIRAGARALLSVEPGRELPCP